jgi:hypothetical protein
MRGTGKGASMRDKESISVLKALAGLNTSDSELLADHLAARNSPVKNEPVLLGPKLMLLAGGIPLLADGPITFSARQEDFDRVSLWWPFAALRGTAAEKKPALFERVLRDFLHKLGIDPPPKVFMRSGRPRGRPKSARGEKIVRTWHERGHPRTGSGSFAKACFPEYSKENSEKKRYLRDVCDKTIRRVYAAEEIKEFSRPNRKPKRS